MLDDFLRGKFVLQLDNRDYDLEFIERVKHIKYKGLKPIVVINRARNTYGNEGCIRYYNEVFRYGRKGFYERGGIKVIPMCEFIGEIIEQYNITEDDLDSMFEE